MKQHHSSGPPSPHIISGEAELLMCDSLWLVSVTSLKNMLGSAVSLCYNTAIQLHSTYTSDLIDKCVFVLPT